MSSQGSFDDDHIPSSEWTNFLSDDFYDVHVEPKKTSKKQQQVQVQTRENQNEHDLTMEFLTKERLKNKIRNVTVSEYEIVEKHVVYKIEVHVQECSWVVSRRYREFHHLHEELVQRYGIAWELLPPKRILGNLNPVHIEKRKLLLDKYLTNLRHMFVDMPRVLIEFLEIDQFDVNTVCNHLSRDLFEIGDELLSKRLVFKITPLQIHCINRRLQLPLPTCDGQNPQEDIGHLYSFLQQVRKVLVYPGDESHMFLGQNDITYNLSIFKSLRYLEIQRCDIDLMEGIEDIQKDLREIRAHKSIHLLKDFLIGGDSWSQGILMTVSAGKESHNDIVNQFQKWNKVQRASFSYNDLHSIDYSITLLPNLRLLDLSHNLLTDVQYLEEFTFLTDLDLSYNEIRHLAEFPYRIPSVSKLNLAGNGIHNISGLEKLYALQHLNLANNKLGQVSDVLLLGNLPLLEVFCVRGNPLTNVSNYRERILVQFGDRSAEVELDGYISNRKEAARISELLASQENYDIIKEEPLPIATGQTTTVQERNPALNASQKTSPRSPRIRKKDRIAKIDGAPVTSAMPEHLTKLENDEKNFRDEIEKLREHAGESWLTFYNEMHEDKESNDAVCDTEEKSEHSDGDKHPIATEGAEIRPEEKTDGEVAAMKKPFSRYLSTEVIDLELSDEMRASVNQIIRDGDDLSNETFLTVHQDGNGAVEERMVAIDSESKLLIEIGLNTGLTISSYRLESIRGLTVLEENQNCTLQFETKEARTDVDGYVLVKLRTNTVKDASGLYVILKSYNDRSGARSRYQSLTSVDVTRGLIDNPFDIPNQILLMFFQEFIRKSSLQKKTSTSPTYVQQQQQATARTTNYENINMGLSLLKHDVNDSSNQDIVSILWVGCLPYLFPDEEIPVCVVMTTINIFLFRIFLPDEYSDNPKVLHTLSGVQEAMHCFFSFSLHAIREIVVSLFDQGVRVEVSEEGPRGTFVFLTRDVTKTSQFLDSISSVLGLKNETDSAQKLTKSHGLPSIVYPDENKINALKMQLQEQQLPPLDNRENLISYAIIYERGWEEGPNESDESELKPNLRSLILTNSRLILCEEDYVHWPLPSYVRSTPFTPQWIVDDIEDVSNIVGVNLWTENKGRENFIGCYGVSITFDNRVREESSDGKVDLNNSWNLLFQSLAEREQFVRSLACLWKNNYDQDLKVIYSKLGYLSAKNKGHSKKPSGNITIPPSQCIDEPDMFLKVDRARLNDVFCNKIAQGDDLGLASVQFITCAGCKPYNYSDLEFDVTLILGKFNIYMITSAQNRKYILANTPFEDESGGKALYINVIKIADLQQVVVGLFDQCFRLETGLPGQTFVFVTRDFDRTNDFVQRLSQVILALPKELHVIDNTDVAAVLPSRTTSIPALFQMYKQEDENSSNYYPKSEFIHPNSNIKFVYPSDETLEKLRYKIQDYIRIMDLFPHEDDFSVLLYALINQSINNEVAPCTIVVSEKFVCLINEDHVNYPLPLFVKELPDRTQYEIVGVQLLTALLRIEFNEIHSGSFSLIFDDAVVDPFSYDVRFKTSSVESDVCLVTDVNAVEEHDEGEKKALIVWTLQAHSYVERDRIFNILSKMWSNFFSGRKLPVLKVKGK